MKKTREYKRNKWVSKKVFALLAIFAITFIAFSSILNNDFTNWDDDVFFTENPFVRSLDFKHIFTNTIFFVYVPLTILSFAIEYHFFGCDSFICHLDNLFLHLAVTGLVFLFTSRLGLTIRVAAFSALLFGIHPMHVESVAWVSERKDVLYAFFYMLALCSYLQYLEDKKVRGYVLTIVFGVLSILAKPMALSLPLILFVCDWVKGRKFKRTVLLEKIPYFLYVVPIAWITYSLNARIPGESFLEGILIWIWTSTFYMWKFLFPIILIPLYSLPNPVSVSNFHYIFAICILFLLLICFVRYRRNRWLIFVGLFYFVSIFFLLRYDSHDRVIVADRFMYLPSLGICILGGILWEKIMICTNKRGIVMRRFVSFCFIVFFFALCIKTYLQGKVWKNSLTLWSYVLHHAADNTEKVNAVAYKARGGAYYKKRQYDLAMADLNKALEITPDNSSYKAEVYCDRGIVYLKQGKNDLAFTDFSKAIDINPWFVEAYNNRGIAHMEMGLLNLALADLNKALEIDPHYIAAYNNRSYVYAVLSNSEQ